MFTLPSWGCRGIVACTAIGLASWHAPSLSAAPPNGQFPAGSAERAKPRVKEFLDRQESGRRGAIAAIEHKLRGLRRESPSTVQIRSQSLQLESDLRELKAGRRVPVPPLDFAPLLGQIGRLPEGGAHLEQILSADRMLVRATFAVPVVTSAGGVPRGEMTHQPLWFLIRGIETAGLGEGSDIPLAETLYVSGRWRYRTATGGRNSVLVLEPYQAP